MHWPPAARVRVVRGRWPELGRRLGFLGGVGAGASNVGRAVDQTSGGASPTT
jgi:hypothetical protein